jgi:hypothetical protein
MALKTINQNPKITDTIRFTIETPDAGDCYVADPYKVDNVKIFYIERDFISSNFGEYTKRHFDEELVEQLKLANEAVCLDPTPENIFQVERLNNELISTAKENTFYYKDAVLVEQIGEDLNPAWLSTDVDNALIDKVDEDEDGNALIGVYTFDWTPRSKVREGDFFVCWTWTPNIAGDSLSAHISFSLMGDGKAVQSLPTHITADDKYNILLERYLPEVYKSRLSVDDITPETTDKLNQAVAGGFTFLEDFANQIIDLYDANVLHESLLVYLSNLFNLKLKSDDPTLWRRQIKEAVPLFKKKGTLGGLKDAFSQAGMKLDRYMPLWQVVSKYTMEQSFLVKNSPVFKLDKLPITPVNATNFAVWIRREGESDYTLVDNDTIEFSETDCQYFATWVGDEKSANSIDLFEGDILRILYQFAEVPSGEQATEDYIRALPVADTRDEALQEYPPKNWNVRVIEEDDPMFDVIIPVRHPFHEHLIFGQVRTEFPYSENIYNMEEYNNSTRDSGDVCFIDKGFRDPCGNCKSSKYNVDIGIEGLSDDRLVEVRDILREYTPFTSVHHNINFKGDVVDLVKPPVEQIDVLVLFSLIENVISGESNPFYHRVREDALTNWVVDREDLASQVTRVSGASGTGFNSRIALVSTNTNFDNLGVILGNHIIEILSPAPNAGKHGFSSIEGQTGIMDLSKSDTPIVEPLTGDSFTFNLSNVIYTSPTGSNATSITQESCSVLEDLTEDITHLSIRTNWDVEDNPVDGIYDNSPDYTGGVWQVNFPSLSMTVDIDRIIDGKLYFPCDGTTVIPAGTYTYNILDDSSTIMLTSTTGDITVSNRGRLHVEDYSFGPLLDLSELIRHGDTLVYDGSEYLIDELRIDGDLIVNDYTDGDAMGSSVSFQFLRSLLTNEVGFFVYSGMELTTVADHETGFGIQNGTGSPITDPNLILDNSDFKENYLIQIDDNYYKIEEINGTNVKLSGLPQDWTLAGQAVTYSFLQFEKDSFEANFVVYDQLDRRGKDPVIREIESTVTNDVAIVALSQQGGSGIEQLVSQEQSVFFDIEYSNGETEQGEL